MKTVAVDFDGVIHRYSKGWQDGSIYEEPMAGASSGLSALMSEFAVFVHTTRQPSGVASWLINRMGFATTWYEPLLHEYGKAQRYQFRTGEGLRNWEEDFPEFWNEQGVLLVTNVKLPAVAYLDDRGIRFETWEQSLRDIERFTRQEEKADFKLLAGEAHEFLRFECLRCGDGTIVEDPDEHARSHGLSRYSLDSASAHRRGK